MYAFVFIVSLVVGMFSAQMLASVSPDDIAALERATKKIRALHDKTSIHNRSYIVCFDSIPRRVCHPANGSKLPADH